MKPEIRAKEIVRSEETTIRAHKWKDGKAGPAGNLIATPST